MSDDIPLGQRESLRLEFKGADVLKDPEKIAREVVAMLNAEGGEVWVGLREEEEQAVAVEHIANPDVEKRRLWDFLVDVIEPPLTSKEVSIEVQSNGSEKFVLHLRIFPVDERKPYAFLKRGGRYYVIRVGSRIRPMVREEIIQGALSPDPGIEQAESKILRERGALLEHEQEVFWIRFEPGSRKLLDIQDQRLEDLLQDPLRSGNRPTGWNFSQFSERPKIEQGGKLSVGDEYRRVEIRKDGGLTFLAALDSMMWKGEELEIWPPILIEYIVSAVRMTSIIYAEVLSSSDPVVTDLVITGLNGWKLRPGTPGRWFLSNRLSKFTETRDLLLDQPLIFYFEELQQSPDRCGYRLVERVYEAFGIRRENIPKFFDSETGRLIFPE